MSFAQVVSQYGGVHLNQPLVRTIRGDSVCIKISQHGYELAIEERKTSLHARLSLQKGDSPLSTCDLR